MDDKQIIFKLKEIAQGWGGNIIKLTKNRFDDYWNITSAPFSCYLGINYEARKIYYVGTPHPCDIIHEMGHIFASKKPPEEAYEWDFFGWEYLLARKVGLSLNRFIESNLLYNLPQIER
jgi:hypothetical protein